jgi:hypothetical protein
MSLVFLSIQTFAVALICLELAPQAALHAETALLRIKDCLTAAGALAMTDAILDSYNQMMCISRRSLSSVDPCVAPLLMEFQEQFARGAF